MRHMLINRFSILTAVMITLICAYMAYSFAVTLRRGTEELADINMKAAESILSIRFNEYENLLYQMYTNDDMVVWADNINKGEDAAVSVSKMRRYLSTVLNSNRFIKSIMVIMDNGRVITYDQLTSTIHENSWISRFSLSSDEIYRVVSADYGSHVWPTEFGTRFANNDYWLFHIAHRIVNYKQLEKLYGVIVISIDERLLEEVMLTVKTEDSEVYITDETGRIVSCADKSLIGTTFKPAAGSSVDRLENGILGWNIIRVHDNSRYMQSLLEKLLQIVCMGAVLMAAALFIISKISGKLTRDIDEIVEGMQRTDEAGIPARLPRKEEMLSEIDVIAKQYNRTIDDLEKALLREKTETENSRKAEIRMLEAQINPHFIYNILDTVNWIAIEKDEYDISNAISTLASILRYAISNSDKPVTLRDEADWLKKYVYLQQFRLKNRFSFEIRTDPEILDVRVHKLIIQPFVENAIMHGFDTRRETYTLKVSMLSEGDKVAITIADNGKGIAPEILAALGSGDVKEIRDKAGIGLSNAFLRLHRYCEGQDEVSVQSVLDEGTTVTIRFPFTVPREPGNDSTEH
ncbi:MAG: sensor histidine kinase [Clostridia bacterium]|nr:sensor histidine kinase [Clostridia bacterium]